MKQSEALEVLKMGHNVFLTGGPGSGKTYVLNQYLEYLYAHGVSVGVTASTGVAATHINGVTIHSWSGMGIHDRLSDEEIALLYEKSYLKQRITYTDVLVIDEISMLTASQLDTVDAICRRFKGNSRPFGGIQVVLSGDFFQLPPIGSGDREVDFVTQSEAWNALDIQVCYLTEQHRHEDGTLANVLHAIRTNTVTEEIWDVLRTCYKRDFHEGVIPTKLYTHNIDVDAINAQELARLDAEQKVFDMYSNGVRGLVETLTKSCLAPASLALKRGAAVMFVKNNFEKGYVNGTLGVVIDFNDEGLPVVETFDGQEIVPAYESWSVRDGGEELASIAQIPLRLAWAITVHKSQGMSLDASVMDLSKSFVSGMGYVALSRVRRLSGLSLLGLNAKALEVDKKVHELDEKLQHLSDRVVAELQSIDAKERRQQQEEFINAVGSSDVSSSDTKRKRNNKNKSSTLEKTRILVEEEKSLAEIAEERGIQTRTILTHLEKLKKNDSDLDMEYLRPDEKVFKKVKKAFEATGDTKLNPVYDALDGVYDYDTIALVRLFLGE